MRELLPLFLTLAGRDVVLVGGGPVATSKLQALVDAGARVRVVAPDVTPAIAQAGVDIVRRAFVPADLDRAWLVVAAATPEVNREVADAAEARRLFVNAVDDPANATAFLSGTVRRDGVTIAVSTSGEAPALTALLREALDGVLPADLDRWMAEAQRQRTIWRRDEVPMAARKPRLLEALNELYGRSDPLRQGYGGPPKLSAEAEDLRYNRDGVAQTLSADVAQASSPAEGADVAQDFSPASRGHVSLVGAGPGDPGLLTRTAIARLRAADLVLYDALIDPRILRYARKAQRFFAGKRAGRPSGDETPRPIEAMTQQTIQTVMIRAARRGRRVVRLKGGDPFVFGRGGEEALALRRAGVPFDVVPGVSSAIAAPALAGIPVTHRGVSSAFLVVSGHDDETFAPVIGRLDPNGLTLVILMGVGRSAAIATRLVERGWSPETPAAIVVDASTPHQQVWRGTLSQLEKGDGSLFSKSVKRLPSPFSGTIIVGDVVALASGRAEAAEGPERLYVTGT
jgi:uroporphyrin-III C-methyltransferase / precorrin-2 dehydrogenase / sirohydrochlorin ferrochelatase